MKIDLTELLAKVGAEVEISEEKKLNFPAEEVDLASPVNMKLKFLNVGLLVLLSGEVEADIWLDCGRCLKRYKEHLKFPVKEEFDRNHVFPSGKNTELELQERDFVYKIDKDNTIDLSDILRQNFVLALPAKPLCNKNCSGGQIKEVKDKKKVPDPRLAKLKDLKIKKK